MTRFRSAESKLMEECNSARMDMDMVSSDMLAGERATAEGEACAQMAIRTDGGRDGGIGQACPAGKSKTGSE